MYLKRLELQGFKSFADKTVLEFKPGITSVIGPNGSGKSNILDSIRWVLGEQSMKSLRGAKSEDIIFAGTQNRKSLGFAEASIVIDNQDGKLPIEYSEVTVTRKIYRSGETGYFINKVPCRLKDIVELFMDTGIGKDGYSIIGQGKIDEILSNKSEDRRRIFEEAAGITKYRTRKVESEKKLEQTKLNLLRINDIITEIENKIEPLKIQSEKAKHFLDLREELKNVEVGLFLHNIETYKEKIKHMIEDEEILNSNYNDSAKKQEETKALKDTLKQEIDEIINEIEKLQNIGFESSNKIEKINSEINVSKERMTNNEENIKRFKEEIEEIEKRIKELEDEIKNKNEKKENLFANKEKYAKELKEKEEELKNLSEKMSEKELEIEKDKKVVEELTDKKYEIITQLNTLKTNQENIGKREKEKKSEIQVAISELDSIRSTKNEISKGFYEIETKKNKKQLELETMKKEKIDIDERINNYENDINKRTQELRILESRYKFLVETEKEKEGYTKSVKQLLLDCEKNENLNKGVHGVLANLVSVDKKYETAIEMALGGMLQNVITENENDAKRLVEHLRENKLGRASFLPISSVKGNKLIKYESKGVKGIVGVASDLLKYDKKYDGIIQSLLGRTLIVDDIKNAIEVAKKNSYSFRIVTLQGDIINPSGGITGGSVAQKTLNILGRSREIETLEKTIEKLKIEIETIESEKEKYKESTKDVIEGIENLEKELQEIDIVYATEKQKIVSVEENLEKVQTRLEKLKDEVKSFEQQKQEFENETNKNNELMQDIEKQSEELNVKITSFANLNKDNQKYIDDLNCDITDLKISVSSFNDSETSLDEIIERINLDINNGKVSLENKNTQIQNIKEENKKLVKTIEELKLEIEKINQEVSNSTENVEALKEKRVEKNVTLEKYEQTITEQFNLLEDLKEQLVKIDVKKTKMQQDLENVINNMWDEYELTPNNVEGYSKPTNIQETQKQVNNIRAEIRDLGSINIDSIEEYKTTKERYDFMCEQRLDLENTGVKLRKIIQDMTKTMKEQFEEKFKIINKNFNQVFIELFGGGKAELILEDENNILECGIDIKAQPTGKKLQNMMLLSGGEKAFTAIALLFAILKINPAPFCILDEIEAALDDPNVYRFADYLKKYSKETQFLVITHRKGTMQAADTVYGVTMEENGISKLLSMKLKE